MVLITRQNFANSANRFGVNVEHFVILGMALNQYAMNKIPSTVLMPMLLECKKRPLQSGLIFTLNQYAVPFCILRPILEQYGSNGSLY